MTGPERVETGVHRTPAGGRPYRLHLPSPSPEHRGGGLLVMLHGCTQDPEDFAAGTRMDAWAERAGFAVLYPEQLASAHPQRCWRWFLEAHQRRGEGEPAVLADLVRSVVEEHGLDPGRVFVAGISAGGAMSLVMAATYPDLFAGVAAHSGVPYGAARTLAEAEAVLAGELPSPASLARRLRETMGERARPLPLLLFHGAADPAVAPENSRRTLAAWQLAFPPGDPDDAVADRRTDGPGPDGRPEARARPPVRGGSGARDRAEEAPTGVEADFPRPPDLREAETGNGERRYRRWAWRPRGGAPPMEMWSVEGMGHAWSGGDPAGSYADPDGPDASREIVRFFREAGLR